MEVFMGNIESTGRFSIATLDPGSFSIAELGGEIAVTPQNVINMAWA
jgi:hypothetical protein